MPPCHPAASPWLGKQAESSSSCSSLPPNQSKRGRKQWVKALSSVPNWGVSSLGKKYGALPQCFHPLPNQTGRGMYKLSSLQEKFCFFPQGRSSKLIYGRCFSWRGHVSPGRHWMNACRLVVSTGRSAILPMEV